MLHRCASLCALLSILAAPSVTSTRFFCRYTGQEIVGCDEGSPRDTQMRGDDCCDQRTFRTFQAVRQPSHELESFPGMSSMASQAVEMTPSPPRAWVAANRTPIRAAGPPAFLEHRALLI